MAFLRIINIQTVVPTAAKAVTQAAMARILSNPLTVGAAATGRWTGAVARGCATAGAAALLRSVVWAIGAACEAGPLDAPVGPPGGRVGNLMVGAAVGLGGRLIRTVSFFGWTRPVDFFIGDPASPAGAPGLIGGKSAIMFV
jgi:hypothetical protein